MPEKNLNNGLMNKAAAKYSALLNNEINDTEKEARALDVGIPDRITGRLSRKYGLKLNKSEQHNNRVLGAALVLIAVFCVAVCSPKTVTAVVNVFRELAFVESGKSMEVYPQTKAESGFYVDVPGGFLSEGSFLVGKNIIRTSYQNSGDYIEMTEYSEGYKLIYDNEEQESHRDVEINSHPGKIFRKNNITTIIIDYNGAILEIESSLPEGTLLEIAKSIKSINE